MKTTSATATPTRRESWLGMNWITQKKRLAIYLRDGLSCVYCNASIEDGDRLTLDHLKAHSKGGCNGEHNLVTCCGRCNSARGNRSVRSFCRDVATYLGDAKLAVEIEARVRTTSRRVLKPHLLEAAKLIERRGSAKRALEAL